MMIANKGTQSLEPAIPLYVTRDWTPEKAGGKPPFHLAQDRSTLGTPLGKQRSGEVSHAPKLSVVHPALRKVHLSP